MSDSLFELDEPKLTAQPGDIPIRDEQVQEIRDAFDDTGVTSQDDRKALIESVVFRHVETVRDLYAKEARRIVIRIRERAATPPRAAGSAWDTREEPTWIDKL